MRKIFFFRTAKVQHFFELAKYFIYFRFFRQKNSKTVKFEFYDYSKCFLVKNCYFFLCGVCKWIKIIFHIRNTAFPENLQTKTDFSLSLEMTDKKNVNYKK